MKKILYFIFLLNSFFLTYAQPQSQINHKKNDTFINPLFSGDYPDPSILVDGDTYYIVHSSFEYYPGLTIWKSKDLINWKPVTSALNEYVGSVWAPDLVRYKDKYYIYFPARNTNFVIVADAIEGPWSAPVDLKIGNIDPGHVVDDKGNRYLYFSSGGYVPLSKDGLSVNGDFRTSYNGWPIPRDWTIECHCMEGPKLFKRGDYYYLTVAEGGTAGPATGHMVISARSKSPLGPWENSPYNPLIRAKSSDDTWWSVGHATIFKSVDTQWWMIFHGYKKDHQNMGRQTLLAPVEWTADGWYKLPDNLDIALPIKRPFSGEIYQKYSLDDSFTSTTLKPQWKFFGAYDEERFNATNKGLIIDAKGNSVAESSPLLCMPTDHSYSAQITLEIQGDAIGGLVLFYNHKGYSGILTDGDNILANLRGWQFTTEKNAVNRHVSLKLENRNNIVDMFYSTDNVRWNKIESSLEVSAYHHNVLGDFLSLRIGLVAMGEGSVIFKDFTYKPIP